MHILDLTMQVKCISNITNSTIACGVAYIEFTSSWILAIAWGIVGYCEVDMAVNNGCSNSANHEMYPNITFAGC